MTKRFWLLAITLVLLFAGGAVAQRYPLMDKLADRVVAKYQTSSCEQLAQERAASRARPKPAEEQRVVQLLRQDPQMRGEFFNRVSAPVVNKLFECGMIP